MNEEEVKAAIAAAMKEQTEAAEKRVADLEAELKELKEKKPETPAPATSMRKFDEKENFEIGKRYSLVKVLRSMVAMKDGKMSGEDTGFERELSREIEKQTGRESKGFFVPDQVFARAWSAGGTAGTGGYNLIATDTLFGSFIEALVAQTVLGTAGAQTLTGLVGNIAIPKGAAATAYWVASEGADVGTESVYNIGQVTGTPHTLGAFTDITRKLLNQSGISAEMFVQNALRDAIMRGIDAAAFTGTGTGGQPKGLDNTADVNAVTVTSNNPTKAQLVEFWQKIESANANGASMKFIGSPLVKAKLATSFDIKDVVDGESKKVGAVVAGRGYFLQDNMVEGYEYLTSNLCAQKKLYFGDWSQMILAFWSGIDLTVDTNSLSKSGGVRIVALQDMDVLVRHPQAFSVGAVLS